MEDNQSDRISTEKSAEPKKKTRRVEKRGRHRFDRREEPEAKPEASLRRSIISKLLILFKAYPVVDKYGGMSGMYTSIPVSERGRGGLGIKKHYFTGPDDLVQQLDIFDHHHTNNSLISISRPKLLQLLLPPISNCTRDEERMVKFKRVNGFNMEELLKYCEATTVDQLLDELPPPSLHGSSELVTSDSVLPTNPSSLPDYIPLVQPSSPGVSPPSQPSLLPPPSVHSVPSLPPPHSFVALNQPHPFLVSHPPFQLPPSRQPQFGPPSFSHPLPSPNQRPHYSSHAVSSSPGPFSPRFIPPQKRPAGPISSSIMPQDEAPPPVKRSSLGEDDSNSKSDQSSIIEPVSETSQSSLKVPSSSVLTFTPPEAPSHFPNSDHHPRDIIHISPITTDMTSFQELQAHNPPVCPRFTRKDNSKDVLLKLNTYLSTFIGYWSSQGKHLPLRIVEEETKNILKKVRHDTSVRIDMRDIECWKNYDMLYKRIIEFIRVFCWHTPITTLFELLRILVEFEKVSDFRDLKLGPITKHPDVIRLFQVPEDLQSVPEITAYDIHSKLFAYLNKTKRDEKHKIEDFLDYLKDVFKVASPLHLCIRITSFPLACQINFKFRTSQRRIREKMESESEQKVSKELDFELNNWKKTLRRMSSEIPRELERKDPLQILESVLRVSLKKFPSHSRSRVESFLSTFLHNDSNRKLFLLALYQGVYGVQKMETTPSNSTTNTNPTTPTGTTTATGNASLVHTYSQPTVYRTKSELHNEVIRYLKMLKYPISLESLAQTEQQLLTELGGSYFGSFDHGTFLEFLTKHSSILTALGGSTIGSSEGEGGGGKGIDKKKQKKRDQVLMCIKQIKDQSNHDDISKILKHQFQVDSISQLGCGELDKLITDSQSSSASSSSNISYLSPILANSLVTPGLSSTPLQVDALNVIQSAPLLTDLSLWSHWDLLFKPTLGSLSLFLQDNGIPSLYTSTGAYLKIDPNSTLQDFTAAVECGDPSLSAGHLVSMTVRAGCIGNVSTQLLTTHVHTKLTSMSTTGSMSPELFVLECLVCMPLELAATIGKQVFLDPLRQITGSVNVNSTLLKLTTGPHQRRYLQALGMKLGIKEWIDDYMEMITKPVKHVELVSEMMDTTPPVTSTDSHDTSLQVNNDDIIIMEIEEETVKEEEEKEDMTSTSIHTTLERVTDEECQEIIESIRRDEFGIGLEHDLNPHQKQILDKQKERLGRSLQRLSEELYSKDTHFVLELVQNADDNSYPSSFASKGRPPSLKFSLSKSCITVLNNEIGFVEKNVRAICDVGKSTKDRHNSGYIGQKGIGFKSVFRVTEVPEIHSRGFHIKFDIQSGDPIGYILPQWVETTSSSLVDETEIKKWTTRIILPLKSIDSHHPPSNVSQTNMMSKFQDIQPSLLLFLNRLRCIIIEDKDSDKVHEMTRYDRDNGIIEIHHNNNIDKWLVVRRILTGANQYKPQVTATELALAFPLPDDLHSSLTRNLTPQQVFAYLPLRSYGFRFIVQGDFDLPSSREDVNSNSPWNQWLREGIPQLFMTAIDSFKSLPSLSQVEAMLLVLNFIPLEGEVHDFFQPVTKEILRLFKGSECLPTDLSPSSSNDDDAMEIVMSSVIKRGDGLQDEQSISWKQPSQLLYVKQQLIRDCIPQSLLTSALKLHFLNVALTESINSHLCSQLNIGTVNIDHLIGVAEFVLASYRMHKKERFSSFKKSRSECVYIDDDFEQDKDELDPEKCLFKWLAFWLACVHSLYEEDSSKDVTFLNKLKQIPIIPLSNGEIVSLDTHSIFFPPVSNKVLEKAFQPIYSELHTVHNELYPGSYDDVKDVTAARVFSLLSLLGVKDLNFNDVVEHHIIPQFKAENLKAKRSKMLILYLAFIKHAIDKDMIPRKKIIADIKEDVVLVTNNGLFKPTVDVIHFDPVYKCQQDLSKIFPGVKWTLVSPKYYSFDNNLNWRDFLASLGVQSELTVKRINRTLNPSSAEAISTWKVSKWTRSPDGRYTVHDWVSQDFDQIIKSVECDSLNRRSEQMKELVEMIGKSWESKYNNFTTASYYDGNDVNELGTVTSTFGRTLRNTAWLPAVGLDLKPVSISLGSELYQMTDDLKVLLHNHVSYLGADIKSVSMIQYFNINTSITSVELLKLLCQWSEDSSFYTSLDHMRNVYIRLARSVDNNPYEDSRYILRTFQDKVLIFIPSIDQWRKKSTDDINGTFVSLDKSFWSDKTTVLFNMLKAQVGYPSHLPQILSFYYSSMDDSVKRQIKNAFVSLGVSKEIGLEHLIEILDYNASLSPTPSDKEISSFRSISEVIINCIASEGSSPDFNQKLFFNKVKEARVFPSKSENWVSLDGLYYDDDPEVSKYFVKSGSASQGVQFLNWPDSEQQIPQHFLQICQIPLVSKELSVTLNPMAVRPFNDIKISFHYILPLVQQYTITKFTNEVELLSVEHHNSVAEMLHQLQFFSTLELTCTYCLSNRYYANATLKQCKLQECNPPVVYIVVNEQSEIIERISLVDVVCKIVLPTQYQERNIVRNISILTQFVQELLLENPRSENAQKRFVDKYSLKSLPPELSQWIVKLPEQPVAIKEKEEEPVTNEEVMLTEEDPTVTCSSNNETSSGTDKVSSSWPPRAPPVKIDDTDKGQSSQNVLGGANSECKRRKTTESDVITFKDIRKMKEDDKSETGSQQHHDGQITESKVKSISNTSNTVTGFKSSTSASCDEITQQRKPALGEQNVSGHSLQQVDSPQHHSNNSASKEIDHDRRQSMPSGNTPAAHHSTVRNTTVSLDDTSSSIPFVSRHPRIDLPSIDMTELLQLFNFDFNASLVPQNWKTGRWGEEYVYNLFSYLKRLPNGIPIVDINWVNKNDESYLPYDIEVTAGSDDTTEQEIYYVEVKSTQSQNKDLVPISWNEIKFAQKTERKYLLIRVYNAGRGDKVQIKWLMNLSNVLETKPALSLYLQM